MDFDKKVIFDFFRDLTFDEPTHVYKWEDKKVPISVSGLIKDYVQYVDFEAISRRVASNEGTTPEIVQKRWELKKNKACKKGTEVHLFGELYPFNNHLKPSNGFEKAVVRFWEDLPSFIIPVVMELQMYHKQFNFAGTSDILLYDTRDGTYIIADYKTNEDLFKNFKNRKLLKPFNNLLDNNFNKYQLQLSFYQILFEQLGLKVSKRKLVWLRPSGAYTMYDTKDYTKELLHCLSNKLVA